MSEPLRPLMDLVRERFCYACFGKNDQTCYRPKGHKVKHGSMRVAVRERLLGVPPK
jgi:hypothetical protein